MKLEEYKEWLMENANREEKRAYEVVEEIIEHHTINNPVRKIEIFPRKYSKDGLKIEFDLIIEIKFKKKQILIGVEFKETDLNKVIKQAIVRRPYVNYMYIATKNTYMFKPEEFILMSAFGIGWIIWFEYTDFVKMIFPSKYQWMDIIFDKDIIYKLAKGIAFTMLKNVFDEISEEKGKKIKSLFEYTKEGGD